MPVFDKEMWSVISDDDPHDVVGAISNVVRVYPLKGKKYSVVVRVPSGLFSFMHQVLGVGPDIVESPALLSLEQTQAGWYLALSYNAPTVCDLWMYRELPAWAGRHRCL